MSRAKYVTTNNRQKSRTSCRRRDKEINCGQATTVPHKIHGQTMLTLLSPTAPKKLTTKMQDNVNENAVVYVGPVKDLISQK